MVPKVNVAVKLINSKLHVMKAAVKLTNSKLNVMNAAVKLINSWLGSWIHVVMVNSWLHAVMFPLVVFFKDVVLQFLSPEVFAHSNWQSPVEDVVGVDH